MNTFNISILGGGIGGLCTAVALQQAGFNVRVYEASPEIKPVGAGLMLASNANQALARLGLWESIKKTGHIAAYLRICDRKGKLIQEVDNQKTHETYGFPTVTIHRAELQEILLNQLKPGTVILGKKAISASQSSTAVQVKFEDETEIQTDYLIAADGIHSAVRKGLLPESKPRYAGYTCWRGVTHQLPEGFDPDQFTETWGAKGRFGIVPLAGGRVYWFACINGPQNDASMRAYGPEELSEAFKDCHFPIPQLIRNTPKEAILWNDILDFKPIDKYVFDRIVLLGDAAHATTPNMGQGACQAIEGAVILGTCMREASSPEEAFRAYEKAKLEKAQWVVNNSWAFGKIAQLENPILVGLRNSLFRMMPAKSTEKRMKKLLTFST